MDFMGSIYKKPVCFRDVTVILMLSFLNIISMVFININYETILEKYFVYIRTSEALDIMDVVITITRIYSG